MPIYFSLSEANEALKVIRPIMDQVQVIRRKVLANQKPGLPSKSPQVTAGIKP